MIKINRTAAESVVRDRLREERMPRLAELDVSFMRALEHGQDASAIAAEKQALRDVTEKDLSGLSVNELAALTLTEAMKL